MKNLMYGFGDDRNPGNDTVNVMEEILIEFITDVVRVTAQTLVAGVPNIINSARLLVLNQRKHGYPSKICAGYCRGQQMQKCLHEWKSFCSCRKT